MTDTTYSVPASLAGVQRIALGVGVAGLALMALGYGVDHHQFFRSYLMGFVFWEPAHWIMQTRQFTNLRRRAERPGGPGSMSS